MFHAYCSKVEVTKRQYEHDVHILEATDSTITFSGAKRILDPNKAVAKYYRSGTCNAFKGAATRNISCLENTLYYLINNVWSCVIRSGTETGTESKYDINTVCTRYNFCMDRLAAIRQDITFLRGTDHSSLPSPKGSLDVDLNLDVSYRRRISLLLLHVTISIPYS